MNDLMIDGDGTAWPTASPELRSRHNGDGPGDLIAYLIRNLGYIRIRRSSSGKSNHIAYRPGLISHRAIVAAADRLIASGIERTVVERVEVDAGLYITYDVEDTVAVLVEGGPIKHRRQAHLSEPMSLQRLEGSARLDGMWDMLMLWSMSRGNLSAARDRGLDIEGPGRQYLTRFHAARPHFAELGRGFAVLAKVADSAKDTAVENIPDPAYGSWIADTLCETHRVQEPQLRLIEATIALPGQPVVRGRYEQFSLPWIAPKGEIVVTTQTVTRVAF